MPDQLELQKVIDEQGKITTALREYAEKSAADIKRLGDELPETKVALGRINDHLDAVDAQLTKLNTPAAPTKEEGNSAAKAAFRKALSTPELLTAEDKKYLTPCRISADGEVKALSTDNFTSAGALVAPGQFEEGIVKDMSLYSPVREVAKNLTMAGKSIPIAVRTAAAAASWTAERGTRTEDTTLAFGQKELVSHAMTVLYKATNEQLIDSYFNIEAELSAEFAEAFSVLEGTAFISGTGVNQPTGILSDATITAACTISGSTTVFTGDNLYDLIASVKEIYYNQALFLLHRKTLAFIRKLKSGTGEWLWAPLIAGAPSTIAGYPYRLATDLAAPSSGTYTQNTYPVLFGNFANGYRVGTRLGLTIQRLVEKYAEYGEVGFLGTMRVAGLTANPAAIAALKITT
jgi:HK97 family phage major capsid protein